MVKTKHNIIIAIICFSFYVLLSGCQKSSINGNLDGRWQIMEMEVNGQVENMKDKRLYYNFYLHVCNLTYYGGVFTVGNLRYENNEIYLDFPYINTPDRMEILRTNYGIYSNPVTFTVFFIDKKKLVIGNDESLITFRKF